MSQGQTAFEQNLRINIQQFREYLSQFASCLLTKNERQLSDRARTVYGVLGRLEVFIGSLPNKPSWFSPFNHRLDAFINSKENQREQTAAAVCQFIAENYTAMMNQNWDYLMSSTPPTVKVAEVIREHYIASGAEATFNVLIEQLRSIITKRAIDSLDAIESLEALIELIDKNKQDALAAIVAVQSTKELCAAYLEPAISLKTSRPYLAEVLPTIYDTIRLVSGQISTTFDSGLTGINSALGKLIPVITHRQPNFIRKFEEMDQTAGFLESNSRLQTVEAVKTIIETGETHEDNLDS